jgi:hypothetical protein
VDDHEHFGGIESQITYRQSKLSLPVGSMQTKIVV